MNLLATLAILSWSFFGLTILAAPENDRFENALAFPPKYVHGPESGQDFISGAKLPYNLRGATAESNEPDHDGFVAIRSIWYKWTAPQSGGCQFVADAGNWTMTNRPMIAVYTGTRFEDLQLVSMYKGSKLIEAAMAEFQATTATTYFISVDANSDAGGGCALLLAEGNDSFSGRTRVILTHGMASGHFRTAGATFEPSEPPVNETSSVWFDFVAPESGVYNLSALGYEIKVAAFLGSSLEGLTAIPTSRRSRSYLIQFYASEGDLVSFAVSDPDGFNYKLYTWNLNREYFYDSVPAPAVRIKRRLGGLDLNFESKPRRLYQFESSDDLVHWTTEQELVSTNSNGFYHQETHDEAKRFFRIVAPP